ncbi:hypothetical protein C7U92_21920 [Bradyrhizobium sp. WBOS7]|uniref:Uncharacterized protein n=1 Tax=Bradyrhizobium betae TaxID=244734 RepID=A0AAE9SRW7_9BRAD|nr:hypothetical protein [Bradyrhizobium sp. WBOS2]MDD1573524.1 hypothetical protein [Bradyrhizobium sp. WBOS1]MDD1579355.1 hypothetical protein [Bradyrhizobium sp. WBOS7]MDD1602020.1 hypothetical protein [Bradyrhizobium sp. WBOS16]UUO38230.1 hypothetical protein DCK84_29030 [Bradyrhizobium sp. WBOS01]UUO44396.1 hypothetical protein DCM75_29000 [Bradyrhizobium sp. WBOS02]UUO54804.1 hypothetical protein DCM79_18595 [Bradyrhizobium sp. WBOS07]UUO68805.1 hypothetical protein DCM83_28705 [Bradyrh
MSACGAGADGPRRCGLRDTEIGFAPETIVLRLADLPRIFFAWRMMMTAYLISLALAGLVAIALWETVS